VSFPASLSVRRGDVLSAWSGIRPLVTNPNSKDTQSLARNHIIEVSDNNLITIAGQSLHLVSNAAKRVKILVLWVDKRVCVTGR